MVKSSKKALAVLLAVACLITFMPAMASQSFAAKKLTVKPAKKTIYVKKSITLKANQKVKWSASKSSLKVVKLTSKKAKSVKVTGKKAGKAVVTAKVGKQTKKVTITVKNAPVKKTAVTGVAISAKNVSTAVSKQVVPGEILTAEVTPEDATVKYQWYAGGTAIEGATKANFTVTGSESGKTITVKVTGTDKFEGEVESTATATVETQTLSSVAIVDPSNNDGSFTAYKVGDVLKAKAAGTQTDSTATPATTKSGVEISGVTYQWYRLDSAADAITASKAISGATAQTYTTTSADEGKYIAVIATPITGVKGYAASATTTAGIQKVNSYTLTASTENGKVKAVVKDEKGAVVDTTTGYTFQWAQSTTGTSFAAISGATGAEYSTPKVGYTYQVTVKAPSTVKLDKTSATVVYTGKFMSTASIQDTTYALDNTKTQFATGHVLTVAASGLTYGTDYTTAWYRAAKGTSASTFSTLTSVKLADGATYTLTASDADQAIVAVVTGVGTYAGQDQTVVSTAAASSATFGTLAYSAKDGAFTVGDKTQNFTLYRYAAGASTAEKVGDATTTTGTPTTYKVDATAASLQGYTYFAVSSDKKTVTKGLNFAGTDGTSTTVDVPQYISANLPTA
ncbi:hypothetical protein [Eubacterium pyruvativorans]|nr:hypothetical protein [Eubacterium pyruvativorans]MCI5746869.1 hypothetical protein [Eubacterium pyruvativorans]